jgi:16S rRNA (guanine966-N2)-methyltransferase
MKKPNHTGSGQIRIIGGQWRGRKLPVPESPGLRPTTDRVRETLFNWLAPSWSMRTAWIALPAAAPRAGSAVALCGQHHAAGNGARRRPAAAKNLATLKASHGKVVNTNTLNYLNQPGTPHHIVFVDPPFRKGLLEETLRLLENNGWLADEALIYVESEVENGLPPVPACWQLYREKVAGQVAYRLYQREVKGENHAD